MAKTRNVYSHSSFSNWLLDEHWMAGYNLIGRTTEKAFPSTAVAVFDAIVDECGKEGKGGRVERDCVVYSLRAEEEGLGAQFVGVEKKKDVEGDYEKATKLGGKVCWKGNGEIVCECGWSQEFSVFAQFRVDAGGRCDGDDALKDFFG